ncbi:MAG: MBL fold metallo-hydrolase, partial [Pseudomonadota bacterium]
RRVDVYMDRATLERAHQAFEYCFAGAGSYPPILNAVEIAAGEPVSVDGAGGPITMTGFSQKHGAIQSLGYRIGDLAYSSDLDDVPQRSLPFLENLSVWVVDALRYRTHSSHFNVEQAVDWIGRVGARRGILTNMHQDLDYGELAQALPPHVEPAYDMMVVVP